VAALLAIIPDELRAARVQLGGGNGLGKGFPVRGSSEFPTRAASALITIGKGWGFHHGQAITSARSRLRPVFCLCTVRGSLRRMLA
jgi:hypothetical protein